MEYIHYYGKLKGGDSLMCENIDKIKRLCSSWKEEALKGNGSILIGKSEEYRLLSNGINMHELTIKELEVCCVELTNLLLLKSMNTVVDWDHQFFWAWIGEVVNSKYINYFSQEDEREIQELFSVCIRSTLAGIENPKRNYEEALTYRKNHPIEHNLNEVKNNMQLVLSYISFPLLEGVLKKYCKEYVSLSGKVVKKFDILRGSNYKKIYKVGDSINSIQDLLLLVIQIVGDKSLVRDLKNMLDHIKGLNQQNSNDPCKIIYDWRNSSLHGETNYFTIGGTILNIAIIIILHSIENEYKKELQSINEDVKWNIENNIQVPWSFYPPYI